MKLYHRPKVVREGLGAFLAPWLQRTDAVTDREERVTAERGVGRRRVLLGGSVIFQSRHLLLSANIRESQRKGAELCSSTALTSISTSGRDFRGRPTALILLISLDGTGLEVAHVEE